MSARAGTTAQSTHKKTARAGVAQHAKLRQSALVEDFRRALLKWFAKAGRDLPWRRTRDPYRILVSEVMLQQTQVERVKEYYARFLKNFPTVQDLASADVRAVHAEWAGLGYYARARNLHAASQHVVREHNGEFPACVDTLQKLPGVGRYTAGAVASFAYSIPAPIVDTNVARVLSRVFKIRGAVKSTAAQKKLWMLAEAVLPKQREKIWACNQGLMDLGAMICTARNPNCEKCPMRKFCRSMDQFCVASVTQRKNSGRVSHESKKRSSGHS